MAWPAGQPDSPLLTDLFEGLERGLQIQAVGAGLPNHGGIQVTTYRGPVPSGSRVPPRTSIGMPYQSTRKCPGRKSISHTPPPPLTGSVYGIPSRRAARFRSTGCPVILHHESTNDEPSHVT